MTGWFNIVRWTVAALLGVAGAWIIVANWTVLALWLTRKRTGSTAPLLGPMLVAVAVWISPGVWLHAWWWLPFLVDLGSFSLFLSIPLLVREWRSSRR